MVFPDPSNPDANASNMDDVIELAFAQHTKGCFVLKIENGGGNM
jgi:hypothetical protein